MEGGGSGLAAAAGVQESLEGSWCRRRRQGAGGAGDDAGGRGLLGTQPWVRPLHRGAGNGPSRAGGGRPGWAEAWGADVISPGGTGEVTPSIPGRSSCAKALLERLSELGGRGWTAHPFSPFTAGQLSLSPWAVNLSGWGSTRKRPGKKLQP